MPRAEERSGSDTPLYDVKCSGCGTQQIDVWEPCEVMERPVCSCGGLIERAWLTPAAVIGDECEVQAKHGLCWPDGTPRRFTSKSEMAQAAKKAGLTNYVVHQGNAEGGDRSKHTTRWI